MSDCSLADLARLISKDVGLSGTILKTVNSSYYGLSQTISSIGQALSLLGSDTVVNIINTVLLRNSLSGDDVIAMSNFWDSAVDIAGASALVTDKLQLGSSDEAYTLGLFHDSGIPLMLKKEPDYMSILQQGYSGELPRVIDYENSQLESNHAVVGYFVASSWKLPDHIAKLIAEHHDVIRIFGDESKGESRRKNLLSALKIAEHLCGSYRVLGQQQQDVEFDRIKEPLMLYLGITEIDLNNLHDDLIDQGIGH